MRTSVLVAMALMLAAVPSRAQDASVPPAMPSEAAPLSKDSAAATSTTAAKPRARRIVRLRNSGGLNFGLISYGENLNLVGDADGKTYKMKALNYGAVLTYRKIIRRAKWDFHWEAGLAGGLVNVDSDNSDLTYFRRGVPFAAAVFGGGMLFKPDVLSRFSLGFDVPVVVKYSNYAPPTSTVSFASKTATAVAFALETNLELGGAWFLNQKIGANVTGVTSALWIVTISWLPWR